MCIRDSNNIVSSNLNVVVGDADGADTSIQECLRAHNAHQVTVYCTGEAPRNNVADWPVHRVPSKARAGTRSFFTAKDLEMAKNSDFGLMVWDCKSTGTLSNVIELLKKKKKSVVFVNKTKDFVTVGDESGLENLLHFMSDHARAKAEEKVQRIHARPDLAAKDPHQQRIAAHVDRPCAGADDENDRRQRNQASHKGDEREHGADDDDDDGQKRMGRAAVVVSPTDQVTGQHAQRLGGEEHADLAEARACILRQPRQRRTQRRHRQAQGDKGDEVGVALVAAGTLQGRRNCGG